MKKITQEDVNKAWVAWEKALEDWEARKAWGVWGKAWEKYREARELQRKFEGQEDLK